MPGEVHHELDALRDAFEFEEQAGRPLVVRVTRPLHPANQRLADFFGVQVIVGAQEATASHDCAFPSCPQEAESGRDVCRYHLTTTGGIGMAVCKIDGCESESVDRAGVYGRLCATHREEARESRQAAPPQPRLNGASGSATLSAGARALVPLAAKLDRARGQLAALPSSASAKAAFDEASRRASQQPSPENLARVAEATKQLQTFAPKRTRLEGDVAQAERALGLALQSFARDARGAAAA